ncbi:MAG TPA: hypothetical protein VKZ51_09460, partial [Cyclobacteriaceae bacterium]|nr:hypothetical protein [Cyclobacteriaceae bacterium]
MNPTKKTLIDINNAYIFFCASLYLGLFWSLHFFWFPHYPSYLNLMPAFVLDVIGAEVTPLSSHLFAIVGMFMALFGGLML